ncbi:MAG: hypothetical protein MJ188_07075 [Treponema sp.]|nr:hypothetical protein [Treponema sp.]
MIKKAFTLIIFFFSIFALSSCKMRAEQKSLTNTFELADVFIAENQFKDAEKELHKIEKNVYDSWSYIGLFKRYILMGDKIGAEKIIKKSIKKNAKNLETKAVYAQYLLREHRFEEAETLAEDLRGTKYGSLYSEAVFLNIQKLSEESSQINISDYYKNPNYFTIYYDAYKTSKNPIWIRNCALFSLEKGIFDDAVQLCPESFSNAEDAYFWALVLYDAAKYPDSIQASETARKYLRGYKNQFKDLKTSEIKLVALESDAFMRIYDLNAADEIKSDMMETILYDKKWKLQDFSEEESGLLPVLITNSSIYRKNQNEDKRAEELLFNVVNNWPYYAPALILYSDFAYQSNLEREEDEEILALRKAGIVSLDMERYDNRAKIPLTDAIYRIEEALKVEKEPKLEITLLDLKYKTNKEITVKEKTGDLWNLLENNFSEDKMYEELLVQYVISYLLKTKQDEDAFALYKKFIHRRFLQEQATLENENKNSKKRKQELVYEAENVWEELEKIQSSLDYKTLDFGAVLAAKLSLFDIAEKLYEQIVFDKRNPYDTNRILPSASTPACMNLGNIYYSTGNKSLALDLYGKAAGRESNKYLRAEIFYRIASIYTADGDYKNALHAIDYSTSIYSGSAKAQQLKTYIQGK